LFFTEQTRVVERPVYKTDPFQNYTNDEVREGINYSVRYVCNEPLFKSEQYYTWVVWQDYLERTNRMDDYNYWIMSYAFNI